MPSLDANALLRWLLDDVPEQTARIDQVLHEQKHCYVDDAAIVETVYVLERVMRFPRPAIVEALEVMFSAASLDLDRNLWAAVTREFAQHPELSITDIYLTLHAASRDRGPMYTFDKKLAGHLDDALLP